MPPIDNVPAADWHRWTNENEGVILDVREPHEWATGTLPGAIRMSLGTIPGRLADLDPATPILVVCHSGNRSAVAAQFLARSGYRVANLDGGMAAMSWAS